MVLFFEKGSATQHVWFYQLNLDRNLGKTNALNEKDLAEFVELQKTKEESENSWSINLNDIRWKQRFANFNRVFLLLREAMENDLAKLSQLEKEGVI